MTFVVRGPNQEFSVSMGVAIAGSIQTSSQTIVGQSSRLLVGIGQGSFAAGTGGGTPVGAPWFTLPTRQDEINTYTMLGWTQPAISLSNFQFPAPASVSHHDVHGDPEADDLWTHYQAWKRTGQQVYFDWATIWRDYYASTAAVPTAYYHAITVDDPAGKADGPDYTYDHLFGWGLVLWGVERNDAAALVAAERLLVLIEPIINAFVPGVSGMSYGESRRHARKLLFLCYYCAYNPLPRWIALRDKMIDCWVQNPLWKDTNNSPIVAGGNHFNGRSTTSSNVTTAMYDQGYRSNSTFQYPMHNEALWLAYKQTGRADVRAMLIKMADFTAYYAHNPAHVNAMTGSHYGFSPTGAHWHQIDSYPPWTDPNSMPTSNYDSSPINTLVVGYKLTGEQRYLDRAHVHLLQATHYASATVQGSPKLAGPYQYLDTLRASPETKYFSFNKGQIQYAYLVFENGGAPTVEGATTSLVPYRVPTLPGDVVPIAGDGPAKGGISEWQTNVWADVQPGEAGQTLFGGDTNSAFIASFSNVGAIVQAGGGGHTTRATFGVPVFDFDVGAWQRVWTGGSTNANPANDWKDVRSGTKIHNCGNGPPPDLRETFEGASGGHHADGGTDVRLDTSGNVIDKWTTLCFNADHWTSFPAICPRVADPRNQYWEITRVEPAPYSPTTIKNGSVTVSYPHGWLYQGEWNGLQQDEFPGRFTETGYVTNCVRFQPTPAGTLAPTQSELPAPAHIWDMFFEMTTANGGGPKGSIVCARFLYAGDAGVTTMYWSHRFDLDTGIWHKYSVNNSKSVPYGVPDSSPPGGLPWIQDGSVAACVDPVKQRVFLIGQRTIEKSSRINYLNLSDRTWRNLSVGSGGTTGGGRTENIKVDPDRRLLIMSCQTAPNIRAFDLSTVGPEPIPTAGTGGWRALPITAAPGFSIDPAVNKQIAIYNYGWHYYPPNGKYYRCTLDRPSPIPPDSTPPGTFDYLERLTPPPIIANPPANYYFTQPWVYDHMLLNSPVPRPSVIAYRQSIGGKWFWYIPKLQCFAWIPMDSDGSTRNCVYLIKPY